MSSVGAACGATRIHFVNDFEAQALSLPYLTSHDLTTLNEGRQGAPGNRLVLGPGSGFGCAVLVDSSKPVATYGFAGLMAAHAIRDDQQPGAIGARELTVAVFVPGADAADVAP